jgi:hypothetical protein
MHAGSIVAVAVSGMLVTGSTAHAQQILAAGSIYGGPAQSRAVCYVYNAGTTTLSLSGLQITSQAGDALTLVVNECAARGATITPGAACGFAADIATNQAYSCKALVAPSKTNARGVLEVRDLGGRPLQNVQLR